MKENGLVKLSRLCISGAAGFGLAYLFDEYAPAFGLDSSKTSFAFIRLFAFTTGFVVASQIFLVTFKRRHRRDDKAGD